MTSLKGLNILHIEAGKHLYGGALQVSYLCEAMSHRGLNVFLACPLDAEIKTKVSASVTVLEMPMRGDVDISLVSRLRRVIKAKKIDIVHIHSRRGADSFGLLAAKTMDVPVIISRRVDNKEPHWLAKLKYHCADHVITISEGIRNVLLSEGVRESHVTTVRSAVDTSAFTPIQNEGFKHAFSIPENTFVMGIIAQLIPRKGHSLLFEALKRISFQSPAFCLLVMGRGKQEAVLKEKVRELALEDKVRFLGFRNDIEKILPNLDLVVHPAMIEGLGVSLLQASSCGVPVVASRTGGIPEVIRPGINGWLVEPGDVDNLTDILSELVSKPTILEDYRQRARAFAEAEFSINKMVDGNIAIYCSALALKKDGTQGDHLYTRK